MTFAPGHSGNPAGRPKGARNRATVLLEMIEDGDLQAIQQHLIDKAKGGDLAAATLLYSRLIPPQRPVAPLVQVDMPEGLSLLDKAGRIVEAATGGKISTDAANDLLTALGSIARLQEAAEFEARLARLEEKDHPNA